jgi:hypothetical protein
MIIKRTEFYVVEVSDRLGNTLSHESFIDIKKAIEAFDAEIAYYNTEDNISHEDLHCPMDDSYVFVCDEKMVSLFLVEPDSINYKVS